MRSSASDLQGYTEPIKELINPPHPAAAWPTVGIIILNDGGITIIESPCETEECESDERDRRLGREIVPAFPGVGDELVSGSPLAVGEIVARPEREDDPSDLPLDEVNEDSGFNPSCLIGNETREVVTQPVFPFVTRASGEYGAVEEEEGRPIGLAINGKRRALFAEVDGDLLDRDIRQVPDEEEVEEVIDTMAVKVSKIRGKYETEHEDSLRCGRYKKLTTDPVAVGNTVT